jgi:hypothetical protein
MEDPETSVRTQKPCTYSEQLLTCVRKLIIGLHTMRRVPKRTDCLFSRWQIHTKQIYTKQIYTKHTGQHARTLRALRFIEATHHLEVAIESTRTSASSDISSTHTSGMLMLIWLFGCPVSFGPRFRQRSYEASLEKPHLRWKYDDR